MIFDFQWQYTIQTEPSQFKRWQATHLEHSTDLSALDTSARLIRSRLFIQSAIAAAYKSRAACISVRSMQFVHVEWQVAYPRCKTMIDRLVQPARDHLYSGIYALRMHVVSETHVYTSLIDKLILIAVMSGITIQYRGDKFRC